MPFLLFLIYLGGFATKNSFGDMFLVIVFGALGWLMVKFEWQRPPLLLGLVLGGIAENNFFIASRIYGYSWLSHPGVIFIALIILGGIFYPYLRARVTRDDKKETAFETKPALVKTEPVALTTRIGRTLFALFMIFIFGYVVYEARYGFGAVEPRAAIFPWVIGLPCLLLAIYVLVQESFRSAREIKAGESLYSEPEVDPILARKRTVSIMCWIVGFFLAIWMLGFAPASAIATFLYLKFGARENWPMTATLTVACWLFFFGVFEYALQLPFPYGAIVDFVHTHIPAVQNLFAAIG
jgi:hypothetical protein